MNTTKNQKTFNLESSFENFLLVSQLEGKKPRTISWYKESVLPFLKFCSGCISPEKIEKYSMSLFEKKLSQASIDCKLRATVEKMDSYRVDLI